MKTLIITIFLLIGGLMAQVPTSKFVRYFQRDNGTPLTGARIEIIPQSGTYPTGAILLTEHSTRQGYYYKDGVSDGEYKIYVGTVLYEQNIWIGERRVSDIVDLFNSSNELSGENITNATISTAKLEDYVITTEKILNSAITTEKIADETILLQDLHPSVVTAIVGGNTPIPDTGKINTTGDFIYGNYQAYNGGLAAMGGFAIDLSFAKYFRLPVNSYTPNYAGNVYMPLTLRGLILRNNYGSNDTIPTLNLLRSLSFGSGGSDTGSVKTTGDDYIYGNLCSYGWYKFSGGIRLPLTTSPLLSLEGEIWFNPTSQLFYGYYDEDRGSSDYFAMGRHLSSYAGAATISTVGTITSGTWNGSTIPISYGGTGATNKTTALNNLLPTQTTRPYKFLRTDGYTSNWYDVYYTTYALSLSAAQYSIDLRSYQQSNLFVTCTPDQGGNTITQILGNKDGQTITLHNSFDATSNIVINDGENLILGDTSQDTLSPGESKTFRYSTSSAIWTELGVTPFEDKPDSLDEISVESGSLYYGNGFQGSLAYFDDYERKLMIADEFPPMTGDVPVFDGTAWSYSSWNYVNQTLREEYTKYTKSSYIDYPGYNETTNDSSIVFKTTFAIYIDSVVAVVNDSSFTINCWYSSQRDSLTSTLARKMFTSDQTVTNKTTGTVFTTAINNRTIPKNNFICLAIRGKTGKVNENVFVEIYYKKVL